MPAPSNTPGSNIENNSPPQADIIPSSINENKVGNKAEASPKGNNGQITELQEDIKSGERWLIGVGICGVIINIIIAAVYYGQLGQMRIATTASARSAEAAQKSVSNAEAVFHLDQRAWVSPTTAKEKPNIHGGPLITINFLNSGRTPAKHLNTQYTHQVAPLSNGRPEYPAQSRTQTNIIEVLFPTTSQSLEINSYRPSEVDYFARPTGKTVVVRGRTTFTDVFSNKHWIEFCFYLEDDGWAYCPDHNDSDD